MIPLVYRLVTRLIHKTPLPHGKLAASLAGRRAAEARWIEWASSNRTTGPLVWVHGASVGEGLTAIPVIDRLRATVPGIQLVNSFTSPSVVGWSAAMKTDRSDYLPIDEPRTMAEVLEAVSPSLLVCSRGDLWPGLVSAAASRALPIAVISATVRPTSSRLWAPVRRALRTVYEEVDWLGAASVGDARRWALLGIHEDSITVTGDTRHDQVLERVTNLQSLRTLLEWSCGEPVLVAGSTDARDERITLNAFSRVSVEQPSSRLILVPHDCSAKRIGEVIEAAQRVGVDIMVWSGEPADRDKRCIVVNVVGILADIYAAGVIAYVGGGFHRAGVHAVVEPAALAIPVIVGPQYAAVADAELVVKSQGAIALPQHSPEDPLTAAWIDWIERPDSRRVTGLAARGVLKQGAASVTAKELIRLLEAPRMGINA